MQETRARSLIPEDPICHAAQLLSLCSGAQELQLLKPKALGPCSATLEATAMKKARAPQLESPLLTASREKPAPGKEDPEQPK